MKAKPYIIFGICASVAAILVIPLIDIFCYPDTTYADGFSSIVTYIFGIGFGASLAVYLYRGDRNRQLDDSEPTDVSMDPEEDGQEESEQDQVGSDKGL